MLILVILATSGLAVMYWYVNSHEKEIIRKIEQKYAESFYGKLHIEALHLDWRKLFPFCSAVLQNVEVRDSAWILHQRDAIRVGSIYMSIKMLPLLIGKIRIQQLILHQADFDLFRNTDGLENFAVLKQRKTSGPTGNKNIHIPKIRLEQLHIKVRNEVKRKNFDFYSDRLDLSVRKRKQEYIAQIKSKVLVNSCAFNTGKGSFFKGQFISFKGECRYKPDSNLLSFTKQTALISRNKIDFSAVFHFEKSKPSYWLRLHASHLYYTEGIRSLSPHIAVKLEPFYLNYPFDISLNISGRLNNQPNPRVQLQALVRNNQLITDLGTFDSCSFSAFYTNASQTDSAFGDIHTLVNLKNVKARISGIPFRADSTRVYNLKSPIIYTILQADFPINHLNGLIGKKSFRFGEGEAHIRVKYEGSLSKSNEKIGKLSGRIDISRASIHYRPRALRFRNCDIHIEISHDDVILHESTLYTQRSEIRCKALARNFLSLYLEEPEKISFDAEVSSKHIDLNEFQSFVNKRYSRTKPRRYTANLPDKIDQALDLSSTNLWLDIGGVEYKKFRARNINARISLLKDGIALRQVTLNHAGGSIALNGHIRDEKDRHTAFSINSNLKDVKINELLESFDDFGLRELNARTIRGTVHMQSQISGLFDDSSRLVSGSIRGKSNFEIRNGALINFKPLEKMGRFAFRKKRLSEVNFGTVKNTISIKGNVIEIPPMSIRSDLINLQLSGIYNLGIGTSLDIIVPLFVHDKNNLQDETKLNSGKGFFLHIKSEDDEEGNLHFKWKLRNKEIADAIEERKQLKKKLGKE